ncbi:DUF11 domain-containing protein [Sulfurovum sp. XGS-02]|uniref:DUF11 domain-containing protein n=1 Tax=Sulfurovum sp. XGS-02 TaxID=2925411 RepID=UPI00206789A0|nr:DUF11 domain-containing protein [Sulfurovum sp. XGS-02]UPT77135.1 DUF11 domain-containing protein [Sulfurovum sp. XGS-02]
MKHITILFNLLLFSFLLSTQIYAATYEDAEPTNDSCPGENLSTIVSGVSNFTGTIEDENNGLGIPGIDYSVMHIPNDGNITITWQTDQDGKEASFLVGTSCDDGSYYNGTDRLDTHTTSTFSVSANDVIYLKIYDGEGKGYSINITYNIATPSPGSDLQITKIDSIDPVEINEPFYYIIDVSNTGDTNATNVVVEDDMPTGMDMNKTQTDAASGFWTCDQLAASHHVTCTHNSEIPSGDTHTIYLHVTAPSSAGVVTNNVSVTDANGSYATADEETTITAEIENAENLCYVENTLASALNDDINASCEKRGNFFYGNIGGQDPCVAQVLIVKENNVSTDPITGLVVTKMYAPGLSSGSATAVGGTVLNAGAKTTLNFESFTSYREGYVVYADENWIDDNNLSITDTASDYNPNMNGIALYADYNISNEHHFGRVYACSGVGEGGIEINFSADIIDTSIGTDTAMAGNYNNSLDDTSDTGTNIKYIRTMVAASPTRTIEGVHLDDNGIATPYTPENPAFNFIISPVLINDACSGDVEPIYQPGTNQPAFIIVPPNAYSATGAITVPGNVRKSARMQLISIDPESLSVEGQQCILSSSADGNFAGVPSCANSEVQYSDAFGQDAWDRCGVDGGRPCDSNNHGIADTSDPTYDPDTDSIYVNDYGCYLCTFNVAPVCTTDNFAIRPEKFDMEMSDADAPNLLRAGEEYRVSLTAKDPLDNIQADYTVTDHNFKSDLGTYVTRYFKDGTKDTSGLLHGTSELNTTGIAYMFEGLSSLSTSNPGSAEEIVGVTYDDVGLINLEVYDQEWAAIDNDDTPMDCNSSKHTYICGDKNVTFIPHHFAFEDLTIYNHAGPSSDFTYVADKRGMPSATPPTKSPMAARVDTRIEARNKQDGITQNFKQDYAGNQYYENNITVIQKVKIPTGRTLPNEPHAYVYGDDANESKIDDKLIGFGRAIGTETDSPGTRNIKWYESTYPLDFNFKRELNKAENPFDVNGTYYSISVTSEYVDIDDGDLAKIKGSRVGDDNASTSPCIAPPTGSCVNSNAESKATFYYARTRPSQSFYDDITTSSVTTPIAIDVYCDLTFAECHEYGIDTANAQTNEIDWWLSLGHIENNTRHDGNITLQRSPAGSAIIRSESTATEDPAEVHITSGGIDQTVTVTATVANRPLTIDIELVHNMLPLTLPYYTATPPYTNSWLIYNEGSLELPSPFYKVRFIGTSDWAGHGDTGHVVGGNTSTKKNRRLGW